MINDVSERAFLLELGGNWDKGKGCEDVCDRGGRMGGSKWRLVAKCGRKTRRMKTTIRMSLEDHRVK